MAAITVHADYGSDFTKLTFQYFIHADQYGWSYNTYSTRVGTRSDRFEGRGFELSEDMRLQDGVVTKWSVSDPGLLRFSIAGLVISASKVTAAAITQSQADDRALIASFFAGNDTFVGGNLADVIKLHAGDDTADGGRGADTLYGGPGSDALTGGAGADDLFGEGGRDTFVYNSVSESTITARDTIFDLQTGDRIGLLSIDANAKIAGNQAFSFIGKSAFHGSAGELRYVLKESDTYIYGDVNGDKKVDFSIHLDDAVALTKDYFIL